MRIFFLKLSRYKIILLFLLFIFFNFNNLVFAQSDLLFGQNHYYTVVFRGNGEAIVYTKIVITNPDEKQLTEFSFEIPKVSPSEIVMYQMKLSPECVRFDSSRQFCLEWRDPDYTQHFYYDYGYQGGKTEYQKIQFTKSGNLYRFTLPTPIEPYKSSAVIIAYATKGYVKKSFGLFKFNFETIKVPARIEKIRVVVDVDSELFLKGKKAQVDYKESTLSTGELYAPQSISSRDLDRVVWKIGSYGPLVKEVKNLSPNETFIVKGEYATSWLRLYLSSILITILIIVGIFLGSHFLMKFLKKRNKKESQFESETNQQILSQKSKNLISMFNLTNFLVSLLSVLLVIGLTYLLSFLSDLLRFSNISPIFYLIIFIFIILLYVFIIFGPAIILADKYGWKSFILVLILEFFWFVIFMIIYLKFFQTNFTPIMF